MRYITYCHQVPDQQGPGQAQLHVQVHGGLPGQLLGCPGGHTAPENYQEASGDEKNGCLLATKQFAIIDWTFV